MSEAEQRFQEDLAHIVSPASRQFYDIVKLAATYAAEFSAALLRSGTIETTVHIGAKSHAAVIKADKHGNLHVIAEPSGPKE